MLYKIFNFQNTIISRYLIRNLAVIFFAITFIIGLIVLGNQFVLTAQESIEHGIPIQELLPLIGFNMLRDIPIILTLSFFLSIIITISQLYNNSEAIVINSIGGGEIFFINSIKPIILISFIGIFFLTIFAVPWAKQQKSYAEDKTVNASEFSFITEGKFESFKNGNIIFYASESSMISNDDGQNMEEIFIYAYDENNPIIVLASEAKKYSDSENKSIYLRLKNGIRYEGLPGNKNINILDFDQYDLEIVSGEVQKSLLGFSEIEEKKSVDLITQGGVLANAELQWRISQPISILILSVFGVFLGKSSPRSGRGVNLLIGILIFMIYNNTLVIAKKSIEDGVLNPFIGMWPVHLTLLFILIIFYQIRQGKVTYFIDKIPFLNTKEKSHV
tara:strand:- start:79 stop:1245 length:1167 start_codon:yes stop_codon:yes gene_type:complete